MRISGCTGPGCVFWAIFTAVVVCCGGSQQLPLGHDAVQVNVLGKEFVADNVYLPNSGNLVYEDEVQSLVASLYEGINSTVFAYGEGTPARASQTVEHH